MLNASLSKEAEGPVSEQIPNRRLAAAGEVDLPFLDVSHSRLIGCVQVASAISFLASPLSSYMSGAALVVDG